MKKRLPEFLVYFYSLPNDKFLIHITLLGSEASFMFSCVSFYITLNSIANYCLKRLKTSVTAVIFLDSLTTRICILFEKRNFCVNFTVGLDFVFLPNFTQNRRYMLSHNMTTCFQKFCEFISRTRGFVFLGLFEYCKSFSH